LHLLEASGEVGRKQGMMQQGDEIWLLDRSEENKGQRD
jgi:hypothetical protein